MRSATLESGPTGSTNKIWLGVRYMRSGWCNSLRPKQMRLDGSKDDEVKPDRPGRKFR